MKLNLEIKTINKATRRRSCDVGNVPRASSIVSSFISFLHPLDEVIWCFQRNNKPHERDKYCFSIAIDISIELIWLIQKKNSPSTSLEFVDSVDFMVIVRSIQNSFSFSVEFSSASFRVEFEYNECFTNIASRAFQLNSSSSFICENKRLGKCCYWNILVSRNEIYESALMSDCMLWWSKRRMRFVDSIQLWKVVMSLCSMFQGKWDARGCQTSTV